MIGYRCSLSPGGSNSYTAISINPNTQKKTVYKPSLNYAYKDNTTLNGSVIIGENITGCIGVFINCRSLNASVTIPNINNLNCQQMFENCISLNQNIQIPETVDQTRYMFSNCTSLNQSIKIPDSVLNCDYMFSNCTNLNKPITISNNVGRLFRMFNGCTKYNQNIFINYNNAYYLNLNNMLNNCPGFESNIYISGTLMEFVEVDSMLRNTNNQKRKNIFFNGKYNNNFNITNTASIIGNAISWSAMTNGFYNAAYNIYCYKNY